MQSYIKRLLFVAISIFIIASSTATPIKTLEKKISDSLTVIAKEAIASDTIRKVKLSINPKNKLITVTAADNFAYLPFRHENINRINAALKTILQKDYPNYKIQAKADNINIEELIPDYLRTQADPKKQFKLATQKPPLISKLSVPYTAHQGLADKYIALWGSHGLYYDNYANQWIWQRPPLFLTVEDLLTSSFVLPFLTPMLENAGAQVFMPRERDFQTHEIIVDKDDNNSSVYKESNKRHRWKNHAMGFSNQQAVYVWGENPFEMGTHRSIKTTTNNYDKSTANWTPNIPEKGMYAVYIAYQTHEESTEDAHYTVHHLGGKTEFAINQTMYGGSWLYLGHFLFDKGLNTNGRVELSNYSNTKNKIVTADAVKFGGGMGNIAVAPKVKTNGKNGNNNQTNGNSTPVLSGVPRFMEAAKYWLHWAGVPDSVYSRTTNTHEYNDDFQSRGFWVNYLAGGSEVMPNSKGLNIPLNLAMAMHSDAGILRNDSIVGTLGICTVNNDDKKTIYQNGISRWTARDYVDMIMTEMVEDVRKQWNHEWARRGIWNKSYSESRVPEVPTVLMELFSHQNFFDMEYALDPQFRFTVSRAIYKGILKYLAWQYQYDYVVQPLPVEKFSCNFTARNRVKLSWEAVIDSLESTAIPNSYMVYTRVNEGGFDNGQLVANNYFETTIEAGNIYSFKVTAVNAGGQSFPSEILSCYRDPQASETVLIVNGFDRISAPEHFTLNGFSGFLIDKDGGVPYIEDISFIGPQYEFNDTVAYVSNNRPGHGASSQEYADMVVAGNNFDYPYVHGKSIRASGYSFVSSSAKAVMDDNFNLKQFKVIDLILGKQKKTFRRKLADFSAYETFPLALQNKLTDYCKNGGNMLVTGAFIASDSYDKEKVDQDNFVSNILKIKPMALDTTILGGACYHSFHPEFYAERRYLNFEQKPNSEVYALEHPDILAPADENAFIISTYEGLDLPAGIAYSNAYKVCSFAIPFETIQEKDIRDIIMSEVLEFLFNQTIGQ